MIRLQNGKEFRGFEEAGEFEDVDKCGEAGENVPVAANAGKTEFLVGLFLFIGLAFLGGLILELGKIGAKFKGTYEVTARFSNTAGVIKGTKVRLSGTPIGVVADTPRLEDGLSPKVLVPLAINSDRRLPKNTIFQIQNASVLGDKMIIATIPAEPSLEILHDGMMIEGTEAGGLEAIQGDAIGIVQDARILFKNANETMEKLDHTLDDFHETAVQLAEVTGKVNKRLLDEKNMENFSAILANFEESSRSFKRMGDSLEPLTADVRRTIRKIEEAAEEVSAQVRVIAPALEEAPDTLASIKTTAVKAGRTMDTATKTLGGLDEGGEIKKDAGTFMKNLRRYGVLGYRDASTFDERDPRNRMRGRRR